MTVGLVIQARMGSSRLPGKVLRTVGEKSLLEILLGRMTKSAEIDKIILATTTNPEDEVLLTVAKSMGIDVFRGSEEDVLDRYYRASLDFRLDNVVRVTADCPFVDPEVVDKLTRIFLDSDLDFLSNSEPLPSTWPDGMDVSVFSFPALERAFQSSVLPSEREHVTFHFWRQHSYRSALLDLSEDLSDLRFTVDYEEDLDFLNRLNVIARKDTGQPLSDLSMEEIVRVALANPAFLEINSHFSRGLGWRKSLEEDALFSGG